MGSDHEFDELFRRAHPAACTCVECSSKRISELPKKGLVDGQKRVSGCPVCNGLSQFRFRHGQYWDIYSDYSGKIKGEVRAAWLDDPNRFRCIGCDGVVKRKEIDDPVLGSIEKEVYLSRHNEQNMSMMDEWTRKYHTKVPFWERIRSLFLK